MRRLRAAIALPLGAAFVWVGGAWTQMRGGGDWVTAGGDAQRSSWVRSDPKISPDSLRKPGFAVAWKIKLPGEPSPAATLDRYIGYRGFRSLAFVGSASGNLTAIDTDLGRIEWKKSLAAGPTARDSSVGCPGGMTANVARPASAAFPGAGPGGRGGGGGRGGAAKSGVGAPDEGAVTIAEIAARAAAAPDAGRGGRAGRGAPGPNPFASRVSYLHAISSDGMLHSMYVSNAEEPAPPVPFLPPNANAHGLIVLDNVAYATTSQGCGGVPNGVWALDLTSKQVVHWTANGDMAGSDGAAFGGDATVYAATRSGELAALDPKTLAVKATYKSGDAFTSSPVVFEYKTTTLVAAATKDGRVHLVDAGSLAGAGYPAAASGDLASWQDAAGTRWIVAPSKDSIAAWKVGEQGGAPVLEAGWTSREIASPLSPMVVNGVVFAVSNATSAVLYALDGATGKELWNSGKSLTAPVRSSGLSGSGSQVYLGTGDGTIYAFGFPIEH